MFDEEALLMSVHAVMVDRGLSTEADIDSDYATGEYNHVFFDVSIENEHMAYVIFHYTLMGEIEANHYQNINEAFEFLLDSGAYLANATYHVNGGLMYQLGERLDEKDSGSIEGRLYFDFESSHAFKHEKNAHYLVDEITSYINGIDKEYDLVEETVEIANQ